MNKIDLLRSHNKNEFLKDQRHKMGLKNDNFVAASFNPLAAISKYPINVDLISKWIYGVLENEGKELLFAKAFREKDDICDKWIAEAILKITATGREFAHQDFFRSLPKEKFLVIQMQLLGRMAHLYDQKPNSEQIALFVSSIIKRDDPRLYRSLPIVMLLLSPWLYPAVKHLVTPKFLHIWAAMTYGIGHAGKAYYSVLANQSKPIEGVNEGKLTVPRPRKPDFTWFIEEYEKQFKEYLDKM